MSAQDTLTVELPRPTLGVGEMRVFAHLAHGFDAARWEASWERGEIVGVNDRKPYGYYRAAEFGAAVVHSRDRAEGRLGRLARLGLRAVLGFDLLHAWHNREGILAADAVWTHTESGYLGVAALLALRRPARRPKLIGQSVWLVDRWPRFLPPRRALFRALIRQVDLLTFLSPENAARARALFPGKPVAFVRYGISADALTTRPAHRPRDPVRVLALGNDVHRDWATLVAALGGQAGVEVRIVTRRRIEALLEGAPNVSLHRAGTNAALLALYEWADLVAVPLRPNLHASGITVVEEATGRGLPVVCTDVGGLRGYFGDDAVRYVAVGDAEGLRAAVREVAARPERMAEMVRAAQRPMREGELNSRSYARRHVELTRELLEMAPN